MTLRLNGSTSGYTELDAPPVAGNNSIALPAGNGSAYQILRNGATAGSLEYTDNIVSGTAVASTSGTSIDFTGIPSWVKRVTVVFYEVSTNGGSNVIVQLGTSSGVDTSSNYRGAADNQASGGGLTTSFTNGLALERTAGASYSRQGLATFCRLASNSWVGTYLGSSSTGPTVAFGSTAITLSGTLDRVRITTVNGTDTFDAGSINILYE